MAPPVPRAANGSAHTRTTRTGRAKRVSLGSAGCGGLNGAVSLRGGCAADGAGSLGEGVDVALDDVDLPGLVAGGPVTHTLCWG
jgi:hypothetical protein